MFFFPWIKSTYRKASINFLKSALHFLCFFEKFQAYVGSLQPYYITKNLHIHSLLWDADHGILRVKTFEQSYVYVYL